MPKPKPYEPCYMYHASRECLIDHGQCHFKGIGALCGQIEHTYWYESFHGYIGACYYHEEHADTCHNLLTKKRHAMVMDQE